MLRVWPTATLRFYFQWPWLRNHWYRWKFRGICNARRRREASRWTYRKHARSCTLDELEARMRRAL